MTDRSIQIAEIERRAFEQKQKAMRAKLKSEQMQSLIRVLSQTIVDQVNVPIKALAWEIKTRG